MLKEIIIQSFVAKMLSLYPSSEFKVIESVSKDGREVSLKCQVKEGSLKRFFALTEKDKRASYNSFFKIGDKENVLHPDKDYYKGLLDKNQDFFKLCKLGIWAKFEAGANASQIVFEEGNQIVTLSFGTELEPATLEVAFTKAVLETDFGIFQAPESSFTELVEVRRGIKKELVEKVSFYKIYKGKLFINNIELSSYQGEISDAFYQHLETLPEFSQYQ